MSTYAEARDTIVGALTAPWLAAFPGVPVYYDNAPAIDHDLLTEFLGCAIEFTDSHQADIGPTPRLRAYGSVSFVLGVRAMQGYRASLVKADFLSDLYRFSKLQGVLFQAPHLLPPVEKDGWFLTELLVPFLFDG